jgi:hypothetical protein
MSELFEIYQESIMTCFNKLSVKLDQANNISNDKAVNCVSELNNLLKEAETIVN